MIMYVVYTTFIYSRQKYRSRQVIIAKRMFYYGFFMCMLYSLGLSSFAHTAHRPHVFMYTILHIKNSRKFSGESSETTPRATTLYDKVTTEKVGFKRQEWRRQCSHEYRRI